MVTRSRPAVAALLFTLALTACSGKDSGKDVDKEATPQEVVAAAQQSLAETAGVQLTLTSDGLPEGLTGIEGATGIATNKPAFEGNLAAVVGGLEADVPVIAVDGKVYAQLPFTGDYSDIDPSEYNAPDPAQFLGAETGFPGILGASTDIVKGDSVRGGADNTEILTTFTATVPEDAAKKFLPTAAGDFDAVYLISDDDELREISLTGIFYPDTEAMTYTLAFDDYGTTKDITAP